MHGGDIIGICFGLWRDLWADSEGLLQDCREKVRIQGIIVEFISVKCYNGESLGGQNCFPGSLRDYRRNRRKSLMKKRALNKELQMESPLPWGIWLFPLRLV